MDGKYWLLKGHLRVVMTNKNKKAMFHSINKAEAVIPYLFLSIHPLMSCSADCFLNLFVHVTLFP